MSNQCTIDRLVAEILSPDSFDAHAWAETFSSLFPEDIERTIVKFYDVIGDDVTLKERLRDRNCALVKESGFVAAIQAVNVYRIWNAWNNERCPRCPPTSPRQQRVEDP